ncbi:MAG: hypothetical protein JWR63_763 [Conexibacter sp.]|nr:hypothetical protein [Conexibacter sp.]
MRPTLTGIEQVLADAGGADAPRDRVGQLRGLLGRELQHGVAELQQARSGYEHPVVVAAAADDDGLLAVLPVAPELRADPDVVDERSWLLVAATVGALVESTGATLLSLTAGSDAGRLVLHLASPSVDVELFPLAFEEQIAPVDRLKALALAAPTALIEPEDLRRPIGPAHPLVVALELARLGGRPADPAALAEHEEAVLAILEAAGGGRGDVSRPHDDPDPSRRVARRILQRLDGMGKWGGYHTDFSHLARGFAGNDRALADEVGEALLLSGLLAEKPSVGQRHVFLNPRRAADIRALIERGDVPRDLTLP